MNNLKKYRAILKEFNRSLMMGQDCDAGFKLGYITALFNHDLITLEERAILEQEFVKFLHE